MAISSRHIQGTLLTALGVLVLTPDGLLVRLIHADTWTLLFWRGVFFATGIFGFYAILHGRQVIAKTIGTGLRGLQAAFFFTLSTVCFVLALHGTSVANTLVIIAMAPLVSAVISLIFLKEKVSLSTWIAIFVSSGGIAFIFKGSLNSEHLWGDIFAVGAAVSIAAHITTVRVAKHMDMVPTLGISGLMIAAIGLLLSDSLQVSQSDFLYLVLLGVFVLPLAFGLITVGPRFIPAAEVSLLMLLETFLGPVWVWLVIGEVPSNETLIGGTLVLLTLVLHTIYNARRKPAGTLSTT
ncbi:DMT family transporter [Sneathiella glossodoripedis]|uniref:DMT family transporter n=1 Tax=Sneathiella glossodoripedis TaxID=418853 RepID=UPI00046F0B17|nr:DMT family transporter [Sneathiella glossodoripedis]